MIETKDKTISEQWDEWAARHNIPLPLLEMYRRHGDGPKNATCDFCRDFDGWQCKARGTEDRWFYWWPACGRFRHGGRKHGGDIKGG